MTAFDIIMHLVSMYILPGAFFILLAVNICKLIIDIIAGIIGIFCPDYSKKERR